MWIRAEDDGTILVCRIHPGAKKDSIEGLREDQLVIRLCAPPVEGKANKSLQKYLSERLQVAKSKIVIKSGEKARTKVLHIGGIGPDEVRERLGLTRLP
jgi:uncharacterized protein